MNSLAETDTETKLTDLTYLLDLSEGNNAFVREILEMFIRDMPEAVIQMTDYCRNKEWDKLQMIAHKMKPSLSFIGLAGLQKDIQRIETSASERSGLHKLPEIILLTGRIIKQVVAELQDELINLED